MTLKVVVADDHPVFRDGLSAMLNACDDIDVVAQVADGQAALDAVVEHSPDVVLMDLRMPVVNGIEATARVSGSTAVLVLTMNDDDDSLIAALRAGAKGYLLKEASSDDIERGVRAVARGEAVFGPGVAPQVLAALSGAAPTAPKVEYPFPQLTEREREVLDLLALGHDNAFIAKELFVSDKTVRNNVSNIMTKLLVNTRAAAVAAARDAGIGAS